MEFEFPTLWFWLLLSLTAMAFSVLGYLFGRLHRGPAPDHLDQIGLLDIENAKLRADLDTCKKRLSGTRLPEEIPQEGHRFRKAPDFDAPTAKDGLADMKAIFGKSYPWDDLKIVEGIGPKIEALFHQQGIQSWKALAECSTERCQQILDGGGKSYRIHDPASWPMQAKMAQGGHWQKLWEWQQWHKGGKF